ncbi:hypothetical protein Tco_0494882 [Tanacetum coccineum]
MLLNLDQLQKQLDKDEFQEDRSMAAFWVINKQFQMFIDSQFTWDYDSQMIEKYFAKYTGIKVKQFRETLLQHMGNVKKYVAERTRHNRQYDIRVNKRQMQTHASKVESSKALDADLVVMESNGTESKKQYTSSSLGNYLTHVADADIRLVNDQMSFVEDAEQYQVKSPLLNAELFKMKDMVEKEVYNELSNRFLQLEKHRIPTRKMFTDSTTKVDSEPPNGSNDDITNQYECGLTLNISADPSSKESYSQGVIPLNLHQLNQSFDNLGKCSKDHPLEKVIGNPSRPVLTRSQLQEHAIWCYFVANDNPIPFGGKRSG